MNNDIPSALKDWIPYQFREEAGGDHCRWLYVRDKIFDDPFFDETISRCKQLPQNSKPFRVLSDTTMMKEWAPQIKAIPPSAIIFHVSRCGSTLLSQMLSLDPANIVLPEVPFLDELLRWGHRNGSEEEAISLLKAAMSFYGAQRNEAQRHLFIKADSWHIHFYKQWRQLYPGIPFILLYRRPDEVLRSHQKRRGMQAVQGVIEPSLFDFDEKIFQLTLDEYMAKVMETYLAAFVRILQTDTNTIAVNYNEGMVQVMEKIAAFTGYTIPAGMLEQMKERSGFHAKFPGQLFEEPPLESVRPAYLSKAFELYEEVERLRESR